MGRRRVHPRLRSDATTDEDDLVEVIRDMLEGLLFQQISRHIPDDERVGIVTGTYWVNHIPSGQTYADVDHELPVFRRELGGGDRLEVMLGRRGGVLVTTRRGGITSAGIWRHGVFEQQVMIDPPDS